MKAESGHIVFKEKFRWKSLKDCFEDLLKTFLEETDQVPDDDEIVQMFLRINMMDIEKNRKPEGFNRRGRIRMVFPNTSAKKEFYIRSDSKTTEIIRITEKLSRFLKKAGVPHTVEWDQLKHLQV
ncbi:MAG: hypothetical protein IH630_07165 [Thermoplasmata archaeon]|nr:hypothetical protein [Thermoplasmata archaeon]MCJ7562943.1 hypothetical protein [Thermoplasmata archaeon]TFG70088.1 MAG: hypothetical protein E4H25_03145 [Methanomassiliicoccus sp.]